MTQKYTPVEWEDETPNQPGTLINKARLDQMQSAHHFADGFEEVDAIPTEDPGTEYHKVVYCTADSTFYRWDGTQWTADIDDDTKRLLEEHEADHSNPHAVTKAQVGLGNADNTSDADKPVSTATQAALDAKVDDSQIITAWGTPTDTEIASAKLAKDTLDTKAPTTALTDGSVTKVGTGNVGSDTKPIKLVAGVPTPVTNTLLDNTSVQTISNSKIFSHDASTSAGANVPKGSVEKLGNITVNTTAANRYFFLGGAARDSADTLLAGISMRYNANGNVHFALATTGSNGNPTAQEIAQYNRSTDTWGSAMVSDALDSYATMVRTVNAQTIAGAKTFTGQMIATGQRAYNTANETDVVTIGTLKASTDVVHRTGDETIDGLKSFNYTPRGLRFVSTTSGQKEIFKIPVHTDITNVTTYLVGRVIDKSNTREATFMLAFRTSDYTPVLILSAPVTGLYCTLNADYSVSLWFGSQRVLAFVDTLTRANAASEYDISKYVQAGSTILPSKPTPGTDYPQVVDSTIMPDLVDMATLDGYLAMVRTTGNQSIEGIKTFLNDVIAKKTTGYFYAMQSTNIATLTSIPTNTVDESITARANNGDEIGSIHFRTTSSGERILRLILKGTNGTANAAVNLIHIAANGTITYPWS